MTPRQPGRFKFKTWFRLHTRSAFTSLLVLVLLAVTGILIYPLDQFGLRDIAIRSTWLPARYEINTWRAQMRSLAVAPYGWLFAAHRHGFFVSRDQGQSWEDMTARIPSSAASDPEFYPPILAMYPYDPDILVASGGQGLAISGDRGATWELYGDSDDEDLSQSAIQEITYDPLSGAVLAIDENGFGYRRALNPDEDEGWELFTFKLPHGEQRRFGVIDWGAVALYLHNGQLVGEHNWWMVNHGFGLLLLLLALTGIVPWYRRKRRRRGRKPATSAAKLWRMLHHLSGLVSWPLLLLLPLTGVVLIHAVDFSFLTDAGLPARWFPDRFDQNRWKGPVDPYLRAVAISPNNSSRLWAGHTYGLFASEDLGQTWTDVSVSMPGPIAKRVEHLVVAPGWLHFLGVGNERGLLLSRDYGTSWLHWLQQPVDALFANNTTLYAASGDTVYWQKYYVLASLTPPRWEQIPLSPPYGPGRSIRQTTLYRLLHDLHSGALLGKWFQYGLDIVAGLMIMQNVTGLLLWGVPRWQRRRRRRTLVTNGHRYVSQQQM
ncbi:PepSY domain-containing protein [Candidatus Entotheonella palauensis]|uniref:PepSY domain-containing protein n=1 Tax=Candidatus Entotheonella palauensis TaxID=93172 RepID=UPI000B7E7BC4|nr:PepSY domain-containing protein [Candidatus Entotheonella palauensis]